MYPIGSGYPPTIRNLATSCTAPGGGSVVTFDINKAIGGVALSAVVVLDATQAIVWSDGFDSTVNSQSFYVTGLPNGDYTLAADNGEATATQSFTVNCATDPLRLVGLVLTQPTVAVPTGRVVLEAAGGQPALVQLYISIPGVTSGAVAMTPVAVSYYLDRAGIAAGSYVATVTAGTSAPLVVPFTIQALRGGCTDPESDNYDPLATYNDGSCTIAPRLVLAEELPALVPNGRPVWVTLNSPEIAGAVPAKADAFINLDYLAATPGVVLTVNGYRLESGPVRLATNFVDAASLVEALNAIGPLAAAYDIHLNQDEEVRLTARAEGTRFNLVLSSSDPAKASVVSLPGVNRYHSQRRDQWGCVLEVWVGAPATNPSTWADLYADVYRDTYGELVSAPGGPARPVLAQRIELPYRADNAYRFDIAAALRRFTGHAYPLADGSCPDRLCSFFLKFGEVYAAAGSLRRQRNTYLSGVSWALDAVEVMPEALPGVRVLSRAPSRWLLRPSARGVLASALVSSAGTFGTNYLTETTAFDGAVATAEKNAPESVSTLGGAALNVLLQQSEYSADTLRVAVGLLNQAGDRATLPARVVDTAGGVLTFANGQGGFDSPVFEGVREELTKYAAATYSTGTGTATRNVTTPDAFRLNSGPLTRAEYLWLRRELGNSPAVWYETEAGPVAVSLTAFSPDPDEVKAEYFLAVDCLPQEQPALGLTN